MSAAGVRGLRATYHRVLDKVELMLPEKLRPLYNHPAGNAPGLAPADTFPPSLEASPTPQPSPSTGFVYSSNLPAVPFASPTISPTSVTLVTPYPLGAT